MTELLYNILPTVCVFAGLLVGIWITGGFRRGAIYLPPLVTDPKPPSLTELEPCAFEYKVGDVVLVRDRDGSTERHTITAVRRRIDHDLWYFVAGKQIITPSEIIGGYRP